MGSTELWEHEDVSLGTAWVSPGQTAEPTSELTTLSNKGNSAGLDDGQLVSSFQRGDTTTAAVLYERHVKAVRQVCYANVAKRETAEDLVQETFARLLIALPHFEGDRVGHWLVRVAKNLCIDERRRRWNTEVPLDSAADRTGAAEDFESVIVTQHAVEGVLRELRHPEAALLRDHHLHDLSLRQMAHRWGSTEKSLSVRLVRARRAFARAGAELRTLVAVPLLWRPRLWTARADASAASMAASVGAQLIVVALLGLPPAAAADRAGDAGVVRADVSIQQPDSDVAFARQMRRPPHATKPADHVGISSEAVPNPDHGRAEPVAYDELISPVSVPGTGVRIHQRGLANRPRYRYRAEAPPAVDTTLAEEDKSFVGHDVACPAVAAAPAVVTCEQPR